MADMAEMEPRLRRPFTFIEVVLVQVIGWCFAGLVLDGGKIQRLYSALLTGYWLAVLVLALLVWIAGLVRWEAFFRVVAWTCWVPIAVMVIWMFFGKKILTVLTNT